MSASPTRDVVITGVGVVSPIGIGRTAFWQALCRGESGIRPLPGYIRGDTPTQVGGLLVDFDPKAHVRPRKALKVMCREIQTAFSAAVLAQEDAGLGQEDYAKPRIATVFGSEMMSGEPEELIDAVRECGIPSTQPRVADFGEAAMRKMYPLWMLKYLPNMAACHVGIALGALGANNTLVLGDVSANAALQEGVAAMERNIADCLVSGAAGTRISATRLIFSGGFTTASIRDPVEESSRPMAKDRDGVIGGEGAAVMVVEPTKQALAREAKPLARIAACSSRFVATHGEDARVETAIGSAVRAALQQAGISADQIGAVVSPSMGHPTLDLAEARAIHGLFGDQTPVVAPIASLGHCGAAVGAFSLVAGALILAEKVVPPTRNATSIDPACRIRLLSQPQTLERSAVAVIGYTRQGSASATILVGC